VADTPIFGRGMPLSERFEVFETDPTAHLTEEQKKWKVVRLCSALEHFEILEKQEIENDINELIRALNEACIARGAGRLTIENIKHLIPAFAMEGL
jgi:hypothetical protein